MFQCKIYFLINNHIVFKVPLKFFFYEVRPKQSVAEQVDGGLGGEECIDVKSHATAKSS